MDYKYELQKYNGPESRFTCPACKRKHCFVLYVDALGKPLACDVGRCDHETTCGYHKTPREFFREHPEKKKTLVKTAPVHCEEQKIDYIPMGLIVKSESWNNSLMQYLSKLFPRDDLEKVMKMYHLGSTRKGEIIYPQIDRSGQCRSGKIMAYDDNGHRVKGDRDTVTWLHVRYVKDYCGGSKGFNLKQCLFGEHLLGEEKGKLVGVVESEKTAVVCALNFPSCVWVATGGRYGLTSARCNALAGREVLVYPDADAVADWSNRIKELSYCSKVRLSDWAKNEPAGSKRDIADLLLDKISR